MRKLAALLIFLLGAPSIAAAPQDELSKTQQALEASKQNEAALKQKLEKTASELADLQERATGLAERLQISERRVSNEEAARDKVNAQLSIKQADFNARKADYTATVLTLLRMRELPPTAIFTAPENVKHLMRTASTLELTNEALAKKSAQLKQDMASLQALQTESAAREQSTRRERENLAVEQKNLARELSARQKLQATLGADHARAAAKVADLSKQSKSLQELISKIEANERARAAARTRPTKPEVAMRAFEGSKGSGKAPVSGSVLHRFGERKNANETYRGMVYRTRAGATVVAPYDGEIVFTGPFRDYGRMVLIKHKNGYISLIAGLGDISTALNQTAIRGEPIGTMPGDGAPEAYVELRDKDAKPIDPGDWFANVASN